MDTTMDHRTTGMARKAAKIVGLTFILLGILGFIPGITQMGADGVATADQGRASGMLLGIFHVDLLHNLVHLGSGLLALMASRREDSARTFFKIFGIVYGLVALLGFFSGEWLLGIMANNLADALLHTVLSLAFLYLGFGAHDRTMARDSMTH